MKRRTVHETAPTLVGTFGRAWALDAHAIADKLHRSHPAPELTVATWIVHAPEAHPLWHSYALLGVSLRDVPSMPAPKLHRPGMTHEISVWALHPGRPVYADDSPAVLQGANYVGQFVATSDDDAAARIRVAVAEIVAGQLSPDSDCVPMWRARFERD